MAADFDQGSSNVGCKLLSARATSGEIATAPSARSAIKRTRASESLIAAIISFGGKAVRPDSTISRAFFLTPVSVAVSAAVKTAGVIFPKRCKAQRARILAGTNFSVVAIVVRAGTAAPPRVSAFSRRMRMAFHRTTRFGWVNAPTRASESATVKSG